MGSWTSGSVHQQSMLAREPCWPWSQQHRRRRRTWTMTPIESRKSEHVFRCAISLSSRPWWPTDARRRRASRKWSAEKWVIRPGPPPLYETMSGRGPAQHSTECVTHTAVKIMINVRDPTPIRSGFDWIRCTSLIVHDPQTTLTSLGVSVSSLRDTASATGSSRVPPVPPSPSALALAVARRR